MSDYTPFPVWPRPSDEGGGVTSHGALTGRSSADQHPIDAITGLDAALAAGSETALGATIIDAKGDLIVGTAADTPGRLAVSATNGAVLVADSAETTGLNWAVDPFVVTCPGATPTLIAGVANWGFAMRAYGSGLISKIALQIGTSAGDICVAHYANTGVGPNATPATRLATSGAVACPASGYREVALTVPTYVRTGDWLTVSFSSSSATAFGVAAPGSSIANNGLSWASNGSHPLPSSFAALSGDRQFRLWGVP